MVDLNTAGYTRYRLANAFTLKPIVTALLIVGVQNANCSRHHGLGARMAEQGEETSRRLPVSGLIYRYDRNVNLYRRQ